MKVLVKRQTLLKLTITNQGHLEELEMSAMIVAAFQLGFVYSLLPGPILIASSQHVVMGGWRQGCWFILGVTLADLIYIAIIQWGVSNFLMDNPLVSLGLWVLGGGWLIKLGLDAVRVPFNPHALDETAIHGRHFKQTLADGLFVNLLNPLTVVGWIALGANMVVLWNPTRLSPDGDSLLILLTILCGILTWQLLLVGFMACVRQQIPPQLLKSLSVVGGICLIVYGVSAWVSAANLIN